MSQHTPATQFFAYFRVSTTGQGQNGLGLEVRQTAVQAHLATRPDAMLVAELTDVADGKKRNRPELAKAKPVPK